MEVSHIVFDLIAEYDHKHQLKHVVLLAGHILIIFKTLAFFYDEVTIIGIYENFWLIFCCRAFCNSPITI
jgi:hypothetical protein